VTVYMPTPADEIQPSLTDEGLREPDSAYRFLADQLLRIPAAYRQPAMAEEIRRTTRINRSFNRGFPTIETIDTGRDELAAVVNEIRAQLNRKQP
jgi:hypothetical protein